MSKKEEKKKEENYEEVEVELDDETFMKLAKLAHEKDITFNQLVNELLEDYLKEHDDKE